MITINVYDFLIQAPSACVQNSRQYTKKSQSMWTRTVYTAWVSLQQASFLSIQDTD